MTPAASPPASPHLEKDLRAITADGVAYNAMVGVGETYVPAFALAVGLGDLTAALVATLPMLAGALLQLVTPLAVQRLGSYRRWVVACARLQAASFLPLAVAALLGRIHPAWLFFVMAAYWGFGMGTSPAWNAWVGALVPGPRRATFFAHRTRWAQGALLAALLGGGLILDRGHTLGPTPTLAFALLFALAGGARLLSARFLASQSEPPGLALAHRPLSPGQVVRGLRGTPAGRLLLYLLGMQASVQIAAPFFTPFMLGPLKLSYAAFTALVAASFVARIAVLPALGRLAHRRGSPRLFRLGALGIVPLPALWLVSDEFLYLLGLQVFAGAAWAALELATLLAFFEGLHEDERTSVLTAFNLANTLAMAAGTVLGGAVFYALDGAGAYAALFVLSAGARLLTLALLPRLPESLPMGEPLALRVLAVRPSLGAIQRPILATVSEDPARGEAPGAAAAEGAAAPAQPAGARASSGA